MTQRKLLVGSIALTLAVGALFFVASTGEVDAQSSPNVERCQRGKTKTGTKSDREYYKNNRNACDKALAKVSPSPSTSASVNPSANPSSSPKPSTSPTTSPAVSPTYIPSGKPVSIQQRQWLKASNSTDPIIVDKSKSTRSNLLSGVSGLLGRASTGACADAKSYHAVTPYLKQSRTRLNAGNNIQGPTKGSSYLISSVLTTSGDSTNWLDLSVKVNPAQADSVKISYRISDAGGTSDPEDADWIPLMDPAVKAISCPSEKPWKAAEYNLDAVGKYFQYKVEFDKPNIVIARILMNAQPVKKSDVSVSPNPSTSATPGTGGSEGYGTVTIETKKLILTAPSANPATNSTVDLPDLPSPTPTATAANAGGNPINPICFDEQETDAAANVAFDINQTEGGSTSIRDVTTDDEGLWRGFEEEVDEFPTGTYVIRFKDFERVDYKLVGICVTPDDGKHYLKTQTTPTGGKATIIVRNGENTKVTALYAPRSKPYITMNKFAVNSKNKILKSVVPGQAFRYLIRYENTGDSDAKGVTIEDIIPEQFYVPDVDNETLDSVKSGFTTSIDALGRTKITRKIGDLKKGQKGSFVIPVVMRPDAFGSPDEIAGFIDQQNQQAAQEQSQSQLDSGSGSSSESSSSSSSGESGSSGAGSGLNLQ